MARAERDGRLPAMHGIWPLRDPRRDPRDFLVVLGVQHYGGQPDWLPPSLRGVEPTAFVKADLPPAAALERMLGKLARRDPRLLDLLLGILFKYDP